MLKETHTADYVGQSCPEVGWYGKTCLFSLWTHSLRNQHQQHHTTAQNTSKQLAQCNFYHVCSCMGSVLFSNMLKETHTADYVGQSCPEVGWYGKTCLFSLWTHSLRNQHQQHHTTAQNTSKQLAQCNFYHVCSCMGSVLFSNMLKDTHTADYVGQSFPEVGWYGKTCLFSLWTLVVKSAVRIWIGLDVFFSLTHFATNTSSTTQPHKIPANNLRNAIFTMLVLA